MLLCMLRKRGTFNEVMDRGMLEDIEGATSMNTYLEMTTIARRSKADDCDVH